MEPTLRPLQITTWLRHPEVSAWNFTQEHAQQLESLLELADVSVTKNRDEFLKCLPETDIALVWKFRQEWFGLAPRLRCIATPAAGRDFFDVEPPDAVQLLYGTFHGSLMAETVLGMILGMMRGVLPSARMMQTAQWPVKELAPKMKTLRGSRITILGFGHIGQHIGRLCALLGANITGIRRTVAAPPAWFGRNDKQVSTDQLDKELPQSDVLVLALPSGPDTDNILDARRITLLQKAALLVNVGRGNAIDENALLEAMKTGLVGAACLDVFSNEPLPVDSPLRALPNFYPMPHASAIAPEYMGLFVKELAARLGNRPQ